MDGEFKAGDVVVLKSGGPPMTVESVGEHTFASGRITVCCVWFGEKNKKSNGFFHPAMLEKMEE